jgi:galactokinase
VSEGVRAGSSGRPSFQSLFGRSPAVACDAPGRANLIGEHTDYNGGFVLPTAIPQRTRIELAPRRDRAVSVATLDGGGSAEVLRYTLGAEVRGRGWLDYVQGTSRLLAREGYAVRGFEACIESWIPPGSGLASSAALVVALLRALREAFALDLDDLRIARVSRRVENEFVGARVGIMDPMAACLAVEGTALFIDTRSLHFEQVPLPASVELAVLHSGVTHGHALGGYNARRAECERACELLGVLQLRDLDPADPARLLELPEPLGRRVRHVLSENRRVLAAVEALRAGDGARTGALLFASHESLRDDFEVSVPEVDLIVELARGEAEVFGARLTGGGFGGSVVMLCATGAGGAVAERIARAYAKRSGRSPAVLVPPPSTTLACSRAS